MAPAIEQPAWGRVRISEALNRRGLSISPAGGAGAAVAVSARGAGHRTEAGRCSLLYHSFSYEMSTLWRVYRPRTSSILFNLPR